MIPLVDAMPIVADLNAWGFRDSKIEILCGFTQGYINQIKCGNVREMSQRRARLLYNFWEEEANMRGVDIPPYGSPAPRGTLQTRTESVTT